MTLAWRNLVQDKVRLGLSVTAVALAVMLILVLTGFVSGMGTGNIAYPGGVE